MYYNKPWRDTREDVIIHNAVTVTGHLYTAMLQLKRSYEDVDRARVSQAPFTRFFQAADRSVEARHMLELILNDAGEILVTVSEVIPHPKRGRIAENVANQLFRAITRATRMLA